MTYKTDIEIAQASKLLPIRQVAEGMGIHFDYLELYGNEKAKIDNRFLADMAEKPDGKLILVTAITPTPPGEGKTTVSIGLGDGLRKLDKKAVIALREPSLGPVFGMKGGAAGGGYAQVVPMEDINLHFTGDFHAISAANNLLAALIDNHIYQGNELGIDPNHITWRRCLDMNDRQLRNIISGTSGLANMAERQDGFDITAASEVMAILSLAADMADLKQRLARIVIGYTRGGDPVTAGQLHAEGAMAALLKDAIKPNLVQTLEHTPALIHGGPFANIAHGCNSVIATRMALKLGEYAITEAGFGADLGAEKFLDIKCRAAGLRPDAVVIVATVRALKYHGGADGDMLKKENLKALEQGLPNLLRHIENIINIYGLPAVVAINRFIDDTPAELQMIEKECQEVGVPVALTDVWAKGGEGAVDLAKLVIRAAEESKAFSFCYDVNLPVRRKLETLAKRIYRAAALELTPEANRQLERIQELGFDKLPVCMAKTQFSFSDDPKLLGAPEGFTITIREIRISAGAGFLVALTGKIMTMPGLPKRPNAEKIDVDSGDKISGLF